MRYALIEMVGQPALFLGVDIVGPPIPTLEGLSREYARDVLGYSDQTFKSHGRPTEVCGVIYRCMLQLHAEDHPHAKAFFMGEKIDIYIEGRYPFSARYDGGGVKVNASHVRSYELTFNASGRATLDLNTGYGQPLIGSDDPTIASVAKDIGLSPEPLERILRDAGLGYPVFKAMVELYRQGNETAKAFFTDGLKITVTTGASKYKNIHWQNGWVYGDNDAAIPLYSTALACDWVMAISETPDHNGLEQPRVVVPHNPLRIHDREYLLPRGISDYNRYLILGALTTWPEINEGPFTFLTEPPIELSGKHPAAHNRRIGPYAELQARLLGDRGRRTLLSDMLYGEIAPTAEGLAAIERDVNSVDLNWLVDQMAFGINTLSDYRKVKTLLEPIKRNKDIDDGSR